MAPVPSIKKEKEDPVFCLDSASLDDWLEHDLRASGILGTGSEPLITNNADQLHETDFCLSSHQQKQQSLTVPIAAIFKALATLTAIQQQQQQQSDQQTTPSLPPAVNATCKQGTKRKASGNRSYKEHHDVGQEDIKDDATMKRQRNTDAARRSRLRKAQKMAGLEHRVKELETMNGRLMLRLAVLETERDAARRKHDRQEERMHELEAQLAEAHEALVRQ